MWKKIKCYIKGIPFLSPVCDLFWRSKKKLKNEYKKKRKCFLLVWPIIKAKFFYRRTAFLILTPDHNNIGDHAIAKAELSYFNEMHLRVYEIPYGIMYRLWEEQYLSILNGSLIFFTGGGYLGSLWPESDQIARETVAACARSKIVFLPNSLYYEDTETDKNLFKETISLFHRHKDITIFLREPISFERIKNAFSNSYLIPDMALRLPAVHENCTRKGCLLLLRSDSEKTMTDQNREALLNYVHAIFAGNIAVSDMCVCYSVSPKERDREIELKMKEFCRSELVITDRLHGMIFAAITGTPCIVIESKSQKIKGCYEWIKGLDYIRLCNDFSKIGSIWNEIKGKDYFYDNAKLLPLYNELTEKIKEQ